MTVEKLAGEYFDELVSTLSKEALSEPPNLFLYAIAGRRTVANARLERIADTLLGKYAPRFFEAFFTAVEPVAKPFDFRGYLREKLYTVKVVSGKRAFNSSVRRAVEEASLHHIRPVILTLQGDYFEPRQVGRAVWLSAPASWKMVAGDGAYHRFRGIVFSSARPRRPAAIAKLLEAASGASSG